MRKDVAMAILGLRGDWFSEEDVNKAYKAAIQMNHPDRYAGNDTLRQHAEEQCKLINEARAVLLSRGWDDRPGYYPDEKDPFVREPGSEPSHGCEADASEKDGTCSSGGPSQGPAAPMRSSIAPFLDLWRTSGAYSVLGIVAWGVVFWIEDILPYSMSVAGSLIRFAFMILQFLYALVVYPSLFGLRPKIKSPAAVSFLNCAAGGVVFGPIWNGSLTKGRKGMSNVVFAVLMGMLVVAWALMFGLALSMVLLTY